MKKNVTEILLIIKSRRVMGIWGLNILFVPLVRTLERGHNKKKNVGGGALKRSLPPPPLLLAASLQNHPSQQSVAAHTSSRTNAAVQSHLSRSQRLRFYAAASHPSCRQVGALLSETAGSLPTSGSPVPSILAPLVGGDSGRPLTASEKV